MAAVVVERDVAHRAVERHAPGGGAAARCSGYDYFWVGVLFSHENSPKNARKGRKNGP